MRYLKFVEINLAIFVALFLATGVRASIDCGAIQGTVTDQQKAVIPKAKVTVTNVGTNVQAALTTNSTGFYLAQELVPGTYSVHVESTGSPRWIFRI